MRFTRWLVLIAVCAGWGLMQVAWRTTLLANSYRLGEATERLHRAQTDVAWLTAEVIALQSPARLARVAKERDLKLVAWSHYLPLQPEAGSKP